MASVQQRSNHTLHYFDHFDYPLTKSELHFWLHGPDIEPLPKKPSLKPRAKLLSIRKAREQWSQQKWPIAESIAASLSRIPTIEAIFVTGALAMNNCPADDDIDIMLVTRPHTLWLTRLLTYLVLDGHRRPPSLPEHASSRVANKICDNLYLESSHLHIPRQNLYTAHEILQAKPVVDKNTIHQKFLAANIWTKEYLPNAYKSLSKKISTSEPTKSNIGIMCLNYLCFLFQYLHMRPKITNEHITLHAAFFHPRRYNHKYE